eukprot:COSAG06_NODE_47669_length_337_cov_1.420168_1_plen_79_part_10
MDTMDNPAAAELAEGPTPKAEDEEEMMEAGRPIINSSETVRLLVAVVDERIAAPIPNIRGTFSKVCPYLRRGIARVDLK